MSMPGRDPHQGRDANHVAAVARSLQWADEAAGRTDYADALAWIQTVEVVDGELPEEYKTKRDTWLRALDCHPQARQNAEPAAAQATG